MSRGGKNKRIIHLAKISLFTTWKRHPSLLDTKWLTSVSVDWCTGLRRHNYCSRNAGHNSVGISAVGIQTVWHLAAGIFGICHQSASLGQGLIGRTSGERNQAGVNEQDSAIQSYNLVQEKCYKLRKSIFASQGFWSTPLPINHGERSGPKTLG